METRRLDRVRCDHRAHERSLHQVAACALLWVAACQQPERPRQIEGATPEGGQVTGESHRRESDRILVRPVGFVKNPGWMGIKAVFEGPKGPTERLALAISAAVSSSPDQWLEIVGPNDERPVFEPPDPSLRIQYAAPWDTAAYEVSGHNVRFTYHLGAYVSKEPGEGTYRFRLRADAPYRSLAVERGYADLKIEIDSRQYVALPGQAASPAESNGQEQVPRFEVTLVGFGMSRSWVGVEAVIEGPTPTAERIALALASAVKASPQQWLEIVAPGHELVKLKPADPGLLSPYAAPSVRAVSNMTGKSVRFSSWLGARVDDELAEGDYVYRFRSNSPSRELASKWSLGEIEIRLDARQYLSHAKMRLGGVGE